MSSSMHGSMRTLAWLALGGLAAWTVVQYRAEARDKPGDGKIVALSEDESFALPKQTKEASEPAPQAKSDAWWLGIRGGPVQDPVLRTQLQLAADTGVVVEDVMPDSPAADADLRKHDIILRVNGEALHGMLELRDAVQASEGQPLELRLLRLGQEIDLTVTPGSRPEGLPTQPTDPADSPEGLPGMWQRFGDGFLAPGERQLRVIGPGVFLNAPMAAMPNGVSVQIQSRNGESPQITITREGESWTLRGDDPEGVEALPEDLQPFARNLLQQHSGAAAADGQFQWFANPDLPLGELMPQLRSALEGEVEQRTEAARRRAQERLQRAREQALEGADAVRDRLLDRMERLERRLEEMQEKLDEGNDAAASQEDNLAPAADPTRT